MNFNYQNIIREKNKRIKNILNICDRKDKEIERLNNIINDFEEELERESNMEYEYTDLEYNTFLDIRNTLKTVLKRFRELKGRNEDNV